MKPHLLAATLVLLITPCQTRVTAADPAPPRSVKTIHDMAEPLPDIPGAPRASAVCMRSLTARPSHKGDPHDTLAAIRGFHATRLEWTYGDDPEFIKKVHAVGVEYGGALAAGSYQGKSPPIEWNVVGLDAQRLVPEWMRHWPRPNPWGCANNPEFAAGHVRAALAVVAAGADVIQRDEPEQNMLATQWGGCLCRHCIAGFRFWLERNADPKELAKAGVTDLASFDYAANLRAKNAPSGDGFRRWPEGGALRTYFKQFQLDASVAFHQRWRAELDKQAGRRIAVSCNNGARDWGPVRLPFDFCIGELAFKEATPAHLYECMRQARAHDRIQTITMPLKVVASPAEHESAEWILHTRKTIATAYALGGLIEMPWDTFLPDAQRYFGKPENYADLTAFVRGIAPHLDGHAEAFAAGSGVEDDRWKEIAPPLELGDAAPHVLAVVRAIPGSATTATAAAVHLVDWRDEPQPFSITLRTERFFGDAPTTLRLLQPVAAYERAAHDKAFDSRDYAPLVRSNLLPIAADGMVSLPAVTPWAVLVVEKRDAGARPSE
jgi:hypothetical protein